MKELFEEMIKTLCPYNTLITPLSFYELESLTYLPNTYIDVDDDCCVASSSATAAAIAASLVDTACSSSSNRSSSSNYSTEGKLFLLFMRQLYINIYVCM